MMNKSGGDPSAVRLHDTTPAKLNDYIVHEHLGSGATSDCFRVVCKANHKSYVLKEMFLEDLSEEDQLRARQEILVMDGVDHPNVVQLRESFAGESCADIIMEYCEGGTLEELIERQRLEGKPFPEDVLIEWMAELLCALAYIHSKRILHRDIKTSNIYVSAKNHLKLGDFGVCTILSNANMKAESMIGTPLYFAPEVCENEAYDERSDVWSLGVVFYEMCTLRRPFDGANIFTLIQNILSAEVASFNTGLDSCFEDIVRQMLSKNPEDRPRALALIDEHLNVPISHPSHLSQKASRSRLIQQYSGPELRFTKAWPPAQKDVEKVNAKYAITSEWLCTGAALDTFKSIRQTTYGMAPLPATKSATSGGVKPPSSRAANAAGTARSEAKTAKKGLSTSTSKSTSTQLCRRTAANASLDDTGRSGAAQNSDSPSLCASSYDFDMEDLRRDLSKRRSVMFGERPEEFVEDALVLEMDASATSRQSVGNRELKTSVSKRSTFLDDVAAVLDQHSANGRVVKVEVLDDAIALLTQYKVARHGLS